MRTFKKTICIEEFISRIPGLFPYLEFDEFGILVKHKATDSIDGCYGKIIPDLMINDEKIPYRSLMRDYYEGGLDPEIDVNKLETITKGIGRIDIRETFNVDSTEYSFTESQILVPEFIYAAEAKSMLSELYNLKKSCEIYNRGGLMASKSLCCDCDKFNKMGGDTMIIFLEKIAIPNAEQWAEELFNNFSNDTQYYVNISLTGNYEDIGYLTPYLYKGECGGNETPISTEKRKYIITISKNEYDNLDETEKSKYGKYHFLKGFNSSSILVNDDVSYVDDNAYQSFGDDDKAKYNDYITYVKISDDNIVENGYTDSKLKSLRCYTTYMNDDNVYEKPDEGEDWLFFYLKGYVANYEAVKDENGNITTLDESPVDIDSDGYAVNLAVYGNVITDIIRNATDRSITFEYYINAHLKAEKKEGGEDGIIYYKFPFKYCDGGVKQTETYYYAEGGEIDGMSGDEFNQYTDISNANYIDRRFENRKCAFSTLNSLSETERRIYDKNVSIANIQSKFEYTRENTVEVYNADVFKEDYLMGVHFKPMVENNVNIKRGNNSAFERHIRLGEVKTLEDMENYMNGSFFNIQQLV